MGLFDKIKTIFNKKEEKKEKDLVKKEIEKKNWF